MAVGKSQAVLHIIWAFLAVDNYEKTTNVLIVLLSRIRRGSLADS